MAADPQRIQELVVGASALPPADRGAYLDRECGADAELRELVAALLAAHDAAGGAAAERPDPRMTGEFTPDPVDGPRTGVTTDDRPAGAAGDVIAGRYTLVEIVGVGGMGEVWVAKQTSPVKRIVALKLIKAGMDSRAVLQRFEAERQALALMDHPNIARVLDGGMTADRRPFFVMELVDGKSLTRFCDEAKLGIRERLELFVAVCQAVQHAHQKGIVHRDIKPSNILVTTVDGKPLPKVIDFGVAKAVGGRLTEESLSTQFGAVVGTLEYMSPEQAGITAADVDTRSDIYSLGVILYELLTGLRPIDGQRLRRAALTEMVRILKEEEPSKPSTRLSTNESLPSLAALRHTEPKKLMAVLRGELDWVVMKCLEKDRNRRYETANGLARDLQRYLANEPVEARPPSAAYRLRKFVRRHRGAAVAATVVLLALLGTVAVSSTAAVMIWREQKRTEAERNNAAANADAAIEVVRNLSTYAESYEMGSGNSAANDLQRKDRLDAALASYERLLALHPEDLTVRWNVARMYRMGANLNRFLDKTAEAEKSYQESMGHFNRLLAADPTNSTYREGNALTLRDYGMHLQRLGRYQESTKIQDDCIRLYEDLHRSEPGEPTYQRVLANLLITRADQELLAGKPVESESSARRAAELYVTLAKTPSSRPLPVDPLFHAMADHNLAMALREQNKIIDAIAAHDRAVDQIAGLTKVTNSRDAWSFYHRTRTERAWTWARDPNRTAAAIADLEDAILGWDKLNKQMGEIPTDLERRAVAGLYCGRIKTRVGPRDSATEELTAAAKILEGLVGKQPDVPMYRYDLGRTYTALGQTAGDPQTAAGWYLKARGMLAEALRRYPENVPYRQALNELDGLTAAKQ